MAGSNSKNVSISPDTQTSPLYSDIEDIIKPHDDPYRYNFSFLCKIHTKEDDFDSSYGIIVNKLSIMRDYENSIGDYMELSVMVPVGLFLYKIYPYLENIEITLITTKQLNKGKKPFEVTDRYKGVYLLDKNMNIPNLLSGGQVLMDNMPPITVTFQLLDRSIETLRVKTTDGAFDPEVTETENEPNGFLKCIISTECKKITIDGKPSLDALYLEKVDTEEKLGKVVIPSKTRLVELPKYLQEKNVGLYLGGVGTYVQKFGTDVNEFKKIYSVFSLYNTKKYEDSDYKIIFYNPVSSEVSSTSHITYKYKDKVLRILPISIPKIEDNKEANVMSYGSGFKFANSNSYMKKPVEMDEKKGPKFIPKKLVTDIGYKDREDGLNFAPNKGLSNNIFSHISEVLKYNGNRIQIDVNHFDIDYIAPGAKCKIVYLDKENKVQETYGVITKVYSLFTDEGMNPITKYQTTTIYMSSKTKIEVFLNSN